MFRKIKYWLFRTILAFVLISVIGVLFFRWVPVPCTGLMLIRKVEAWQGKSTAPPLRYVWKSYDEISSHVPIAIVASEDQLFPDHYGFDLKAIEKAVEHNKKRKKIRGASTITQQVAKNLFLWPGRSYVRKAFEVWFTLLIETFWPKQRILEVYMNIAETGKLIFGFEAAAQAYFNKPAKKLSAEQAALIVACLPSPLKMNPARPSAYMQQRKAHILHQVNLLGGIEYLK